MKNTILQIIIIVLLSCFNCKSFGQEYFTKNGNITFYSKATLENISANNNQVISLLNIQTGSLRFSVLINAFHFPKAMMEEHFQSDYLESDKYPSSTFKGTVTGIEKIDTSEDGVYNVSVAGNLQIHGITKEISAPGTISIKDGKIIASSEFTIPLKDYHIEIPSIVINNISDKIKINVNCLYEKRISN